MFSLGLWVGVLKSDKHPCGPKVEKTTNWVVLTIDMSLAAALIIIGLLGLKGRLPVGHKGITALLVVGTIQGIAGVGLFIIDILAGNKKTSVQFPFYRAACFRRSAIK